MGTCWQVLLFSNCSRAAYKYCIQVRRPFPPQRNMYEKKEKRKKKYSKKERKSLYTNCGTSCEVPLAHAAVKQLAPLF
jgi:hypothetical protein